jgi:hypothetical protein
VFNVATAMVRKELLWLVSNVAAGTGEQAELVYKSDWVIVAIDALRDGDTKQQVEGLLLVYMYIYFPTCIQHRFWWQIWCNRKTLPLSIVYSHVASSV